MACAPGCLCVLAPVCASWTRVSRGTSLRSFVNPFGDLEANFVVEANLMISRPIWFGSLLVLGMHSVIKQSHPDFLQADNSAIALPGDPLHICAGAAYRFR